MRNPALSTSGMIATAWASHSRAGGMPFSGIPTRLSSTSTAAASVAASLPSARAGAAGAAKARSRAGRAERVLIRNRSFRAPAGRGRGRREQGGAPGRPPEGSALGPTLPYPRAALNRGGGGRARISGPDLLTLPLAETLTPPRDSAGPASPLQRVTGQ